MSGVWRLGNRNPRNLYRGEEHVGMLIEPELAAKIVETLNGADRAEDWGESCYHRAVDLDRLFEERCAGMDDAARMIEARIQAAYAETGDRGLLQGIAILRDWATNALQGGPAASRWVPEGCGQGAAGSSEGWRPGSLRSIGPDAEDGIVSDNPPG